MIVDASGFVWAFKNKKLHKIGDGKSITLLYYELGNVVWKERKLFETVSKGKAHEAYELWVRWIQKNFEIYEPSWEETMKISLQTGLNFYDSAYLWLARKFNEPILTLDDDFKGLCKIAKI